MTGAPKRRLGTVFLRSAPDPGTGATVMTGYWDGLDEDGDHGHLGDLPSGADLHDALDWAFSRSERIVLTVLEGSVHGIPPGRWFLGTGTPPTGVQRLPQGVL